MSWKNLFDEDALEAGFGLYMAREVDKLRLDGLDVYAEVKGAFVEITLNEDGTVAKARCDGGDMVPEYVAAVMYEVTDPVVQNAYLQDVIDMLERASEDELRDFLEDLVLDKPAVANEARRWFGVSYADLDELEAELSDIVSGYDRDWLSEGAVEALSGELCSFFQKYVPSLSAAERYEDVAELLRAAEYCLSGMGAEAEVVESLLSDLLSYVTALCFEQGKSGRGAIFQELLDIASGRGFGEYTDVLEESLISIFSSKAETGELLSYVDDKLSKVRDMAPRQRYVRYKHTLLVKEGRDEDGVRQALGADWDQPVVTLLRSQELVDKGLLDEALNLLLAAHDRASDNYTRGIVSRELLKLYPETGRTEDEAKELVRFLSCYHFELGYASRLKELTTGGEWEEAKLTIASTLSLEERLEFYQWDDDKEALLSELQRNGSLDDLWEYAEDLLPEYSEEAAELAGTRLLKEVEKAESPSDYHYLGAFLREMAELMPEERQTFWEAYGLICEMYPRNTLLRQELRDALRDLREV